MVYLDLKDPKDLWEHLENQEKRDCKEFLDPKDHLVLLDREVNNKLEITLLSSFN